MLFLSQSGHFNKIFNSISYGNVLFTGYLEAFDSVVKNKDDVCPMNIVKNLKSFRLQGTSDLLPYKTGL